MDRVSLVKAIAEAHHSLEQTKVDDLGRDEAVNLVMLAHQHRGRSADDAGGGEPGEVGAD